MAGQRFGWCFVGAGSIAGRVLRDLAYTQSGAYVASVHAAHVQSAQAFAAQAPGAKAYATLRAAVLAPDVQAVYIATPHHLHCALAIEALRLGKPVLCEKPFALNRAQAEAMIAAARHERQYLMEGMWTRFNPAIRQALRWVALGCIGEVIGLRATFSTRVAGNMPKRLFSLDAGGGSLMDIGVYTVALARMLFGENPSRIEAVAQRLDSGVDGQCAIVLGQSGGAVCRLYSSVVVNEGHEAVIYGERGRICLPRFAMPDKAELWIDDTCETYAADKQGEGFQFEFDAAASDILAGRLENKWISHQYTLDVMQTLDTIRSRIDLRFAPDGMEPSET